MATLVFTNNTGLTIADNGVVSQEIQASFLRGQSNTAAPCTVVNVSIWLNGLSHTFADDLDMLLVGPDGRRNLEFLSDAGGAADFDNAYLAYLTTATNSIPNMTPGIAPIAGGSYLPVVYGEPETAADFGFADAFTVFGSTSPNSSYLYGFSGLPTNGAWTLAVRDDTAGNTGSFASWSLGITVLENQIRLDGTGGNDTISVDALDTISGIVSINGQTHFVYWDVVGFDFYAGDGDDTITCAGGNDWYQEEGGNDTVNGAGGNDTANYGAATVGLNIHADIGVVDAIAAGLGFDTLISFEIFICGNGNNEFWGASASEAVYSGFGNDWLHGFAGGDTLNGGGGSDQILGGEGADQLFGAGGNDYLWFDETDLIVHGGTGTDYAYLTTANGCNVNLYTSDLEGVWAGDGNDILNAGFVFSSVFLVGYGGTDQLTGGYGNDYFWLDYSSADFVNGGAGGRDAMYHTGANGITIDLSFHNIEVVVGAGGADLLVAFGAGTYVQLYGRGGNDELRGSAFGDYLYGDDNDDTLRGNSGNDYLNGGDGFDNAQYVGVATDYTVTALGGGRYDVTGFGFTDRLVGVEQLVFDGGGTLAL